MITTKRHDPRLGAQRRNALPLAELLERLGHLLPGDVIVKGGYGDVTAVDDLGPVGVGIDVRARVETSEGGLAGRSLTDGSRAEAGALRTVRES